MQPSEQLRILRTFAKNRRSNVRLQMSLIPQRGTGKNPPEKRQKRSQRNQRRHSQQRGYDGVSPGQWTAFHHFQEHGWLIHVLIN